MRLSRLQSEYACSIICFEGACTNRSTWMSWLTWYTLETTSVMAGFRCVASRSQQLSWRNVKRTSFNMEEQFLRLPLAHISLALTGCRGGSFTGVGLAVLAPTRFARHYFNRASYFAKHHVHR